MKTLILALALTVSPALADNLDTQFENFDQSAMGVQVSPSKPVAETIKEQQAEIDELKKQIEELKKQNAPHAEESMANPSKHKKHLTKGLGDALFGAATLFAATRTYNNASWNQPYQADHPITGVNMVNPMTGSSTFNGVQW